VSREQAAFHISPIGPISPIRGRFYRVILTATVPRARVEHEEDDEDEYDAKRQAPNDGR
jgi:hypothetical protein